MGKVTGKLADSLAAFDASDHAFDAALKKMGLPGLVGASTRVAAPLPVVMELCTIQPLAARHTALRKALVAGADPNETCQWGAMALDTLYTDGDADGIALVLSYGADAQSYGWSNTHLAVIHDLINDVGQVDYHREDSVGDTPFVLACRLGRQSAAKKLVARSQFVDALLAASQMRQTHVVSWLLDEGADINAVGRDGMTPLLYAVQTADFEATKLLLNHGADVTAAVCEMTFTPDIARLLVAFGADPTKFQGCVQSAALGVDKLAPIHISRHIFAAQYPVRPGRANPERVDVPFWREQIRTGNSGDLAKKTAVGRDVQTNAPIWSFERDGQTATRLRDGRLIMIGGQHAKRGDANFCIYNDVNVIEPDGGITQYIYPTAAFPPTGFHTATHFDDGIWLIGNLGYAGNRVHGRTQVMWLSLTDFSIHNVATSGQSPGWIHGHRATLVDQAIHITGGKTEPGCRDTKGAYVLDLRDRVWHAVN